jgi:hypothetical protein
MNKLEENNNQWEELKNLFYFFPNNMTENNLDFLDKFRPYNSKLKHEMMIVNSNSRVDENFNFLVDDEDNYDSFVKALLDPEWRATLETRMEISKYIFEKHVVSRYEKLDNLVDENIFEEDLKFNTLAEMAKAYLEFFKANPQFLANVDDRVSLDFYKYVCGQSGGRRRSRRRSYKRSKKSLRSHKKNLKKLYK